jgi:hypothetical protein
MNMDEKPKHGEKKKRGEVRYLAETYPCPVCGGTEFTWGVPSSYWGV